MGLWSRIKKAAKWVARKVKAVVRIAIRIVMTGVMLGINVVDLVLGFWEWPEKNLTLHVIILSKFDPVKNVRVPLCQLNDPHLLGSIGHIKRILKDRFNVKLRPYVNDYVEIFDGEAPSKALKPDCGKLLGQEFVSSGEFYAQHTAGWNGSPVSLRFPITVFVVEDVLDGDSMGCSNGPLADYIVIQVAGLNQANSKFLMMHELGHACSLWHSSGASNIMYKEKDRGDGSKWFQSNLLRSSRHVTYW